MTVVPRPVKRNFEVGDKQWIAGQVLKANGQLPAGHRHRAALDSSGIFDSERSPEDFKENHAAMERPI
jgi:hypothetical protein